jgi:hypothetical protein
MKPVLLFSPDEAAGSGSSEPVKRLAARYHIPENDVEALLYGSRAPKIGQESSSLNETRTMQDDFRPSYGAPQRDRGWSPVTILSIVVGLLGLMALTILLIAVIRKDNLHDRERIAYDRMMIPPPIMHPPVQPPQPQQDTTKKPGLSDNAQSADANPPSENEMAKPAPKHHTPRTPSGFSTSNSLEAQEHLAELRAEGNTKARIHESTRNGVTIYTVR